MGVKSTALRFGDSTKEWISGFGTACISSLALCGFNSDIGNYVYILFMVELCYLYSPKHSATPPRPRQTENPLSPSKIPFFILVHCSIHFKFCDAGWPYYACLVAASGHLVWQIWTVDLSSRIDCNKKWVPHLDWDMLVLGMKSLKWNVDKNRKDWCYTDTILDFIF